MTNSVEICYNKLVLVRLKEGDFKLGAKNNVEKKEATDKKSTVNKTTTKESSTKESAVKNPSTKDSSAKESKAKNPSAKDSTALVVSKQTNNYEDTKKTSTFSKVSIALLFIPVLLLLAFSVFTFYNTTSETIANGVFIKGVNVSGLSKESAKDSIETFIKEHSSDEIILKHNDYETSVSLEQISANFDIDSAINEAYSLNKKSNILVNSLQALRLLVAHTDIEPKFTCDEEQLTKTLEDISPNLPDTIIESSYYIEGNTLVATKGRKGNIVNVPEMKEYVKSQINNLNFRDKPINMITIEKTPKTLDMDAIYNEVHKEAKDAYFTPEPLAFYPSEDGIDFAISLDEAKQMVNAAEGEECEIPLKVLTPNVTTNMIGNEAFPDQLSEFSTRYVNNPNRTTNLRLAANKINGTVVMPGETFSYNKVVGERTIAAGYKDAAIYVDGETVDGLAGGICQVSTTLYEAALYANLEIVERLNHQFVPSYIGAGLDATVVWGLTDFQFKNNRNYPIKILCSVENGVCYFQIRGLATADDYQVKISATSSSTATSINAVTYKTLFKNGQQVSSEVISRDTYKRH